MKRRSIKLLSKSKFEYLSHLASLTEDGNTYGPVRLNNNLSEWLHDNAGYNVALTRIGRSDGSSTYIASPGQIKNRSLGFRIVLPLKDRELLR